MWVVIKSKIEEILISPSSNHDNKNFQSKMDNYESIMDYSYYNDMKILKDESHGYFNYHQQRPSPPKTPRSPNIFPLSTFINYQFNYLLSFFIYIYDLWRNTMTFFFLSPIEIILDFIVSYIYFIYVTIPMMIISYIWGQILYYLGKICRRYELARKCLIHISEIIKVVELIWRKAKRASLFDLTCFIVQNLYEIVCLWIWPSSILNRRTSSLTELSELLEYEEIQYNGKPNSSTNNKNTNLINNNNTTNDESFKFAHNKKYMHHDIPFNPFKATIKVRKIVPLSTGGAIAVTNTNSLSNSNHSCNPHNANNANNATSNTISTNTNNNTTNTNTNTNATVLNNKLLPFSIMDLFSRPKSTDEENESLLNFETEMLSDSFLEQFSILNDADTPASFPRKYLSLYEYIIRVYTCRYKYMSLYECRSII